MNKLSSLSMLALLTLLPLARPAAAECVTEICRSGGDPGATCGGDGCVCTLPGYEDSDGVCVDGDACRHNRCDDEGDFAAACFDIPGPGTGYICSCSDGYEVESGTCVEIPTPTPTDPAAPTPTATATMPSHDSVILPLKPLTVKLREDDSSISKIIKVKVQNADLEETPGHTIQVHAEDGTCPAGTVAGLPDLDKKIAGAQDAILVAGGKSAKAVVTLQISAAAFTTFNRVAPSRCTLALSVSSPGASDATPANNSVPLELNVLDHNDGEQSAIHETWLRSIAPQKISIGGGVGHKHASAKAVAGNADISPEPESPGDTITVIALDGTCPSGTMGTADYDKATEGAQNSVTVAGGKTATAKLPVIAAAAGFASANPKSPARCLATITASGPGGDTDGSNNTTTLVIDVYDKNDH